MINWMKQEGNMSILINSTSKYSLITTSSGARGITSTITITDTDPFDAAEYVCVAMNIVSEVMSQATLTVYGK